MKEKEVEGLLELMRSPSPRVRREALHKACPCEIRSNVDAVWKRLLEMRTDPNRRVRSLVLHALCDGSPIAREDDVVAAVESMQSDLDPRIRRRARGVVAAYRRTGCINQL